MKKLLLSLSLSTIVLFIAVSPSFASDFTVSNVYWDGENISFDTSPDISNGGNTPFPGSISVTSPDGNTLYLGTGISCNGTHCVNQGSGVSYYNDPAGQTVVVSIDSNNDVGLGTSQPFTWPADLASINNLQFDGNTLSFDYTGLDLTNLGSIDIYDPLTSNVVLYGQSYGYPATALFNCTSTHCTITGLLTTYLSENYCQPNNVVMQFYDANANYINQINYTNWLAVQACTPTPTPTNTPPVVAAITTSASPVQVNSVVTASANFTDANASDTHTAIWNWGDGNTSTGTVTENNGSGSVSDNHTYTKLGSYTITLTVTDNGGLSNATQLVISVVPTNGLSGSNLSHTNYSGSDLSNQNLTRANLSVATFNNVDFQSANLSQANGSNSSFTNDNFTGANLQGSNFSNANLSGSNFTNAIITGANWSNANLTNGNFTGANLTGSNFSGTIKTGIIWSNTICPNGQNSNNHNNSCAGQGGGL